MQAITIIRGSRLEIRRLGPWWAISTRLGCPRIRPGTMEALGRQTSSKLPITSRTRLPWSSLSWEGKITWWIRKLLTWSTLTTTTHLVGPWAASTSRSKTRICITTWFLNRSKLCREGIWLRLIIRILLLLHRKLRFPPNRTAAWASTRKKLTTTTPTWPWS